MNASGTDRAITFNYDYSANSIPEAPNSEPGVTALAALGGLGLIGLARRRR